MVDIKTSYYVKMNAEGEFKLTELGRQSVGVSDNTTFILYQGQSYTDKDYVFYTLEIVNVSDGINHYQQLILTQSDMACLGSIFKEASFKSIKEID